MRGHARRWGSRLLILLVVFGGNGAQGGDLPSVEAFGRLPAVSRPALSPDGKYFAVVQSIAGLPAALIYPVGSTKPAILESDKWLIISVKWVKPERLLLTLKINVRARYDRKLRTWIRYATIKPDGSDFQMMMKNDPAFEFNVRTGGIADIDLEDPNTIFMPLFIKPGAGQEFHYSIMRVNVETGFANRVTSALPETMQWVMDGHGNIVARVDQRRNPLIDMLHVYDGRNWSDAGEFNATGDEGANILGLTEDGKALVRLAVNQNGMKVLVRRDLTTQHEDVLYSNPDYDVLGAIYDEWTMRIVGATYADDRQQFVYFDPNREALQKGLEKAFPGLTVQIVSYNLAMDKVIVEVEGPKLPATCYYINRTSHQAIMIASSYPELKASDLGDMEPYPYTARDGLKIPAYLTLPPGREAKNLPAVILPHGGPDARDTISFDWWAQFLANRGYAVLQMNYRGSAGYGEKFTAEGLHQWGLKMQDDISDGVKKLVSDGIADPKRICIVGASYGGYAALAGAALTPELYACSVSVAGLSDLRQMLRRVREVGGESSRNYSFWTSRIGDFDDNDEQLIATSPAFHAAAVKGPILLMHGTDDTTVPIEQSLVMYEAMQKAGKPVQFVRLKGDDHYFTLAETRIRMLQELEVFLRKNIGN